MSRSSHSRANWRNSCNGVTVRRRGGCWARAAAASSSAAFARSRAAPSAARIFVHPRRGASRARNEEFTAPYSKIKAEIAQTYAVLRELQRQEILPAVPPVPDTSLDDYRNLTARRFANPKIGDTVRRLCLDAVEGASVSAAAIPTCCTCLRRLRCCRWYGVAPSSVVIGVVSGSAVNPTGASVKSAAHLPRPCGGQR